MSVQSRATIAGWFLRGMKPLASQFSVWLDSFWHKNDAIPMESITGLEAALGTAATLAAVKNLFTEVVTLNADGSYVLHADFFLLVVVNSDNDLALIIGTTNGGTEITPVPIAITGGAAESIDFGISAIAGDQTIYFGGISAADATVSFLFLKIPISL